MVYHHVFTLLPFILLPFISFGHKPCPTKGFCGGLAINKFRERLFEGRSLPSRETRFVLFNFVLISFTIFHSISLIIFSYAEIKPITILFNLKFECIRQIYLKRTLNLNDSDLSSFLHFERSSSNYREFKYFRCYRLSDYVLPQLELVEKLTRSTNIIIDGFLSVKADKLQNYYKVTNYVFKKCLVGKLVRHRQSKYNFWSTNSIIPGSLSNKADNYRNYKLVKNKYDCKWVDNLVGQIRQSKIDCK